MRLVKQFFFFGNDLQVLEVLNGTQTVQRAHCALLSDTVALKMRLVKKTATSPPLGTQPQ